MSRAVSTGTPEDSMVAKVRAKRATASSRIRRPTMRMRNFTRSIKARPLGLRAKRRRKRNAPINSGNTSHQ
jgi:hypothetical protein